MIFYNSTSASINCVFTFKHWHYSNSVLTINITCHYFFWCSLLKTQESGDMYSTSSSCVKALHITSAFGLHLKLHNHTVEGYNTSKRSKWNEMIKLTVNVWEYSVPYIWICLKLWLEICLWKEWTRSISWIVALRLFVFVTQLICCWLSLGKLHFHQAQWSCSFGLLQNCSACGYVEQRQIWKVQTSILGLEKTNAASYVIPFCCCFIINET